MNCKNCQNHLKEDAQFCNNCGAKVIENRMSFKLLLNDLFINILGVDGLYFTTLKKMFTQPHIVLTEYLSGVRKRYVNPFGYLAVGAALSLIIFNFFADDFIAFQSTMNSAQITELKEIAEMDLSTIKDVSAKELQKLKVQQRSAKFQLEFQDKWLRFFLNYLNLFAFIFLPLYALMSKTTYRKPYNFGEHLIINAYLQGSTMYISIIMFFIAMLINPNIYGLSILAIIMYYLYTLSKLHNHTFKKAIVKLLKFFLVLIGILIILGILGIITSIILIKTGVIKVPT